ncbi:MAG: porin family protein [Alphaproteobacteria bacterium]|nr:porin family protein [Alphaproteobacteria bacterium]
MIRAKLIYLSGELVMKKGLVLAGALAFCMMTSTIAEARDGFYLTARGGKTWYNLNNKDDSVSKKADMSFDPVTMYSGAIGYKYKYFRGEIEYVVRDNAEEESYNSVGNWANSTYVEAQSLMLNGYIDFMPNYWISPYINGGIGYSEIEFKIRNNQNTFTSEDSKFSWQAGAGLTLRINKCLNIDAGYRYYTLGKIEEGEINGHEWYAGIRFTF